jgi:hypothetical protein
MKPAGDAMKPAATDAMKPAANSMSGGAMSAAPAHTDSGTGMSHASTGM